MLISLGEAITSGPVIAGVVSGGTGVGAAAAGVLLAAGAGAARAVPAGADPSAHALCPPEIRRVRSSAHRRLATVEPGARFFVNNFISLPGNFLKYLFKAAGGAAAPREGTGREPPPIQSESSTTRQAGGAP
jgi:hypothetical protein